MPANSFTPDTEVVMADGSTKPIAEVEVGDRVLAGDPETGQNASRPVTALIEGDGRKDLVEITVATDQPEDATIVATDGHPFWVTTTGEWVDAEDLQPGDHLHTATGDSIEIIEVEHHTADQQVHNLTVADLHTYYVEAGTTQVLAHNCGILQQIVGSIRNKANDTYLGRRLTGRPMEPWRSNRHLHRQLGGRSPEPNATVQDLLDLVPGNPPILYKAANAGVRSDANLLTSVFSPRDGQYIATHVTRPGVIAQGNHRALELISRARDPNSPIQWYTPIFIHRVGE